MQHKQSATKGCASFIVGLTHFQASGHTDTHHHRARARVAPRRCRSARRETSDDEVGERLRVSTPPTHTATRFLFFECWGLGVCVIVSLLRFSMTAVFWFYFHTDPSGFEVVTLREFCLVSHFSNITCQCLASSSLSLLVLLPTHTQNHRQTD